MKYAVTLYIFIGLCYSNKLLGQRTLDQLLRPEYEWSKVQVEGIDVHYIKHSKVDSLLTSNLENIQLGVKKAKNFLGQKYAKKINVITVDDRKVIGQLIGFETDGIALISHNAIIEILGVASDCHEKFHLLSNTVWGIPQLWINEGMAVACDDAWWGNALHPLAHYLMQKQKLIDFTKVVNNDKNFKKQDARISYPLMGSFGKYIDDTYGRKKLLELWRTNNFKKVLNKKCIQVVEDWKEEIQKYNYAKINYLKKINLVH